MIFDEAQQAELKKYTFAVYILLALSFITLITPVIGVIINYVKDEDVRGSWLESHFRWQKATFSPILIGYGVLGVVTIWLIYRIARGWIFLVDGKEMYRVTKGEN
jgi:uncharacterized membrane protein